MNLKTPSNLLSFLLIFLASGWCYTFADADPAELTAQEIGVRSVVVQDDAKRLLAVWASNAPANIDIYQSGSTKRYGQLELPPNGSERIVGIRFGTKPGDGIAAISRTGLWMRWLVAGGLPSETKQLDAAKGLKSLTRFSPDGTWAVCATFDGWSAWNLATGEKIADSDSSDGETQEIVILRKGNAFLSVGTKGATWFDVPQRTALKRVEDIKIRTGTSKISINKKYVAGNGDDKVHIFEVDAMLADFADFKLETVQKEFSFGREDYLLVSNYEPYKSPIDAWNLKGGLKDFRFANPITDRTNGSFAGFPNSNNIVFIGQSEKSYPKHEGILVKQIDDKNTYAFGGGSIHSDRSSDLKYPFIGISSNEEYLVVNYGDREVQIWNLVDYSRYFQSKEGKRRDFSSGPGGVMLGLFELPRSVESASWFCGDEYVVLKLVDGNEFLVSLMKGFDRFDSTLVSLRSPDSMGGSNRIDDIEFSPNGKLISVKCSHDMSVLEAESGREVFSKGDWVASPVGGWFNRSSNKLLVADRNGWHTIDLSSKAATTTRNLNQGRYIVGSQLATKIFIDDKLSVIDPDQPARIRTFDLKPGDCGPIEMSPDCRRVAVAGRNSDGTTLEIFDVESGESFSKINIEKDGAYDVAFVGDGSLVAVCGGSKIRIYDYKRRRLVKEFPKETKEPKRIELSGLPGTVPMQRTIDRLSSMGLLYRQESPFGAMDYHPASNRIAVCRNNFVEIWDLEKENVLFKTGLQAIRGTAIAFSPDGKSVAVGQEDQWIQILKLPVK